MFFTLPLIYILDVLLKHIWILNWFPKDGILFKSMDLEIRHVECSVCEEVYKSALTDVHELCYTISIFCQISQQVVFKIMI